MSTKTTQPDPAMPSVPRKSFWRELTKPEVLVFIVPYVGFALLAYFTPRTILTDWPEARAFTDVMAAIIPMIEVATERGGEFSEVNRFVCSLIWALTPFLAFLFSYHGLKWKWGSSMGFASNSEFMKPILAGVAVFLAMFFFPGKGTPRLNHMGFSSEFMRALLLPGLTLMAAVALSALLTILCAFFSGRIRITGEEK